jgi:hypothetical protein
MAFAAFGDEAVDPHGDKGQRYSEERAEVGRKKEEIGAASGPVLRRFRRHHVVICDFPITCPAALVAEMADLF